MVKLKKSGESNAGSKNSVSAIGDKLRSARENKGLTLEEVYKITKMHPTTLEALEKGQLENKLGETYVRAFLKHYASFLGVDTEVIIEEYSAKKRAAEAKKEGPAKKSEPDKKEPEPEKANPELIRAIVTMIVLLAVLVAVALGVLKVSQYAKSAFSNMKPKAALPKKTAPVKVQPEEAASALIPIPKQKVLTLTLNTTSDVWLKVIADGKVAFHKTLSKQSKETWKAEKEIRLAEIGKPEALKMNVNGKEIDFSGKRPPRSILITHEGVNLEPGQ